MGVLALRLFRFPLFSLKRIRRKFSFDVLVYFWWSVENHKNKIAGQATIRNLRSYLRLIDARQHKVAKVVNATDFIKLTCYVLVEKIVGLEHGDDRERLLEQLNTYIKNVGMLLRTTDSHNAEAIEALGVLSRIETDLLRPPRRIEDKLQLVMVMPGLIEKVSMIRQEVLENNVNFYRSDLQINLTLKRFFTAYTKFERILIITAPKAVLFSYFK